jgi:hypothetical protein
MGVSGQRYAPAALYPRGKDPRYPLDRRLNDSEDWNHVEEHLKNLKNGRKKNSMQFAGEVQ